MESSVLPTLLTLIDDIRSFINNGLAVLPLTIIGTALLISLMSANYAMLFMLMIMIVFVPGLLFFGNMLLELITTPFGAPTSQWLGARSSDLCDLLPPFPVPSRPSIGLQYTFGSYWLAMVSFYIGYTISNAVALLRKDTQMPVNADEPTQKMVQTGQNNRKTQAIGAIITTLLFGLIVIIMRIMNSGCEPYIFSVISIIFFAVFGWVIYIILAAVGQDRLSDIFGIANRLLSPDSMNSVPYACLPPAASP